MLIQQVYIKKPSRVRGNRHHSFLQEYECLAGETNICGCDIRLIENMHIKVHCGIVAEKSIISDWGKYGGDEKKHGGKEA